MTFQLNKACTGYLCENKDRCPLYGRSDNPFNYISPLSFHDKCPHWPPADGWGDGPEVVE